MLSEANEADYLRPPACCRCCAEKTTNCVCQACHDGYHRCPHKESHVRHRTPTVERETTYMAHYCVDRPFKPPPTSFKPLFDNLFPCGEMEEKSTYRRAFQPPRKMHRDVVTCTHPVKDDCESVKKTVYMSDFGPPMTEKEEAMMKWRLWKSEMYAAWLSAARKKSLLSRPKRPPRPYDYSKDDRYTTAGMLYIPKKKWEESKERVEVTLPNYQSDGAVNSYTTGTAMKDTYRVDVDVHNLPCCRPESVYHPDKLQTCIVCNTDAGKPHGTCLLVMYPRPEKPLVDPGYTGPRPAVKECSLYQRSYQAPAENSFLIPSPPCQRRARSQATCPVLAKNLPIPVGYQRCAS